MDKNRWKTVQELFAAALPLAPASRGAYLRDACGGDESLVAEILSLLDAHDGASAVLDRAAGSALLLDGVEIGSEIGRYRIEARIGRGAMGVVYRAHDTRLGRDVALKFLPAYLSDVETVKTRFINEARAASALDHPSICTIYEIDETPAGALFIAMALCEGVDLGRRLKAERLDWRQALRITAQLAAALEAAHRRGIVHRDLKPANVIVGARLARIVDFGIAKISGVNLTDHGAALGTPAYMSPEQLRGGKVDGRADIWALGVMLYEMLCGARPFPGSDARAVLDAMTQQVPRPLLEHETQVPAAVASALQAVLDLCLAADPDQRYQSARDLLADLQHLGAGGDDELGLTDAAAPPQDAPPTASASGQLRRMTVLECVFTSDDAESLLECLPQLKELSARVVTRFEGVITEPGGETVLAWFGYPRAHEDDAARAVRAGLSLIAGAAELARRDGVQVRAAVHSGMMVMRATGGVATLDPAAMIGGVAREAGALAAFAPPSTLLVSGETKALIGRHFDCPPHGELPLGAGRTAETVYRVAAESTARTRRGTAAATTALIGREHELAMLKARWEDAREGRGQCVLIRGEAGIGKSRLLQALGEHVMASPDAWLTHCQCSSHHRNTALHPVIELLLETELESAAAGGVEQTLEQLEGLLAERGQAIADAAPLLANLLSLSAGDRYPPLQISAERQRQKTFEVLLALLLGRASRQPVLFIAEDLHWADPTFLDLLSALLEHVPAAPILAVLTARPELDASRVVPSHAGHVNLGRLSDGETRALIAAVAAGQLRDEEIARLTQQTDGVPLFVEELTKSVLEARQANGASGQAFAVPATLQESLAARLDRLGATKATAQRAAMLGRAFEHTLLQAVDDRDAGELEDDLAKLIASGLLYRRGVGDSAGYVFKHALIQEAAYGSMLPRDRRRQHGRIADVLLERFAERCAREPQLPARHLTAAARGAEAIPWWVKAGRQAQRRSASREAVAHFNAALELLDAVDAAARGPLELETRTAMGPALMALGGYTAPEVEDTYRRALSLAREQGDTPQLVPVLFGLWTYYVVRAELGTARDLGEQLLRLASAGADENLLLEAYTMLGVTLFHTGDIEQARAYLESGTALYDRERHAGHALVYGQDPGMACRCYLASVLWWQGYPDRALAVSDEAVALARGLRHAHSRAFGLYFSARFRYQRGDLDAAIALADEAVALSAEHGFPIWQTLGAMVRGRARVERGERGERELGLAELDAALTLHVSRGAGTSRPYFLALHADALGRVGRIGEALRRVEEALADAFATGAHTERAEILRIRGDLRRLAGQHAAAAADCREALELARRQGARAFALRAAMQLARLLRDDGDAATAHAVLRPATSAFDEGFATRDLAEAADLLATLEQRVEEKSWART